MNPAQQLIEEFRPLARQVSARAFSPYSGFKVGAVVKDAAGIAHAGCNVESASYGLTQCAECNALGCAIAEGMEIGTAVAMLVYLPGDEALPPCGACRQVMVELMAPHALVVSCCDSEEYLAWQMEELLPEPFLPD